jgi:dimethylhistidine N-methyltransferase
MSAMTTPATELRLHDYHPDTGSIREQIVKKLALPNKELPDTLLYSEQGSQFFEAVTHTDGYYLTRTEIAIMESAVKEMAEAIGDATLLVEYGSGSSRKTRLLLSAMPTLSGYVPLDISKEFLLESARQIATDYPTLEVLPVCADYEQNFNIPVPTKPFTRRVGYFPGSTIGNRTQAKALEFLRKVRHDMGEGGGLLIGVDLKKDTQLFANAYNENEPMAQAFVLSSLETLNRDYGADFDLTQFRFQFHYNENEGWVEIGIVSLQNQTVQVCDQRVEFGVNERILLQVACKYTLAEFADLAHQAGWKVQQVWTDDKQWFSVQYLVGIDEQD